MQRLNTAVEEANSFLTKYFQLLILSLEFSVKSVNLNGFMSMHYDLTSSKIILHARFSFRWTHIVCALYIPGVAFGDVDKLSPVTIFEMPTTKWGAKVSNCSFDPAHPGYGVKTDITYNQACHNKLVVIYRQ